MIDHSVVVSVVEAFGRGHIFAFRKRLFCRSELSPDKRGHSVVFLGGSNIESPGLVAFILFGGCFFFES